jgi:hypothetical protein
MIARTLRSRCSQTHTHNVVVLLLLIRQRKLRPFVVLYYTMSLIMILLCYSDAIAAYAALRNVQQYYCLHAASGTSHYASYGAKYCDKCIGVCAC